MTALPVIFALHDPDGSYWLNTAVALSSVVAHAKGPIELHIVHDETLTAGARARLEEIAAPETVNFVEAQLPAELDAGRLGRFSPASIFRLMIPTLFSGEEVVIYLDSDLVLNGVDVHEIAEATPPEAPLSAVVDPYILQFAPSAPLRLQHLGLDPNAYFNSGVLALRPKLLPSDILNQFVAFTAEWRDLAHPDQDFLNWLFKGRAHLLDERFNTGVGYNGQRLVKPLDWYRGRVLHYNSRLKPMAGFVAPGTIPFFAHAHRVPEIYMGELYKPTTYMFPAEGRQNALRGRLIDRDPG